MRPRLPDSLVGVAALLRLLPKVDRRGTIVLAVGGGLTALLPLAVTILTGRLVGSIPETAVGGFGSPAGHTTIILLAGVTAFVVVQRIIGPVLNTVGVVLGREMELYLQERVIGAVIRPADIAHLEDPAVLDLLRVVRGFGMDANRPDQAVASLIHVIPSWIQSMASAVVIMVFHWWLGLAWLILWPVMLHFLQREYLQAGEIGYGKSTALRRAEYLRDLAITPPAAKELRVWGMRDWLIDQFESVWFATMAPVWKARNFSPRVIWSVTIVLLAANFGSYALLAWAAAHGDIGLGAVAIFTQALGGTASFNAFNDGNASLMFGAIAVPKVLELENALAAEKSTPGASAPHPREAIRFENVSFHYPHANDSALRDLDLTIAAGRSLAIVGDNGAGKSTLIKLLCGLYVPDSGRIGIDGTDLRTVDPVSWQRQVAVLFQDFARYHLSVRENIALGAPELSADEERIRSAASKAGALELIESLPKGWDTVLSRQYAEGTDLSGGQWQRIALTRALFAVEAGADVLVLDEPTAALDVRAEAELYDRFLEITEGLTTILISHRFSTVRRAERIVVLADGQIREDGTHEELMRAGGRYSRMFSLQAAHFQADADA
ncbi:MAG TPA: ABC transporter ATP-binding protein [Mycobacteriales bacterium]|nr:ABC transporter ATP-binding protein [Mycobacteriales bacterium]